MFRQYGTDEGVIRVSEELARLLRDKGACSPELQGATKYPDHHVTCREAETGTYGMVGVGADRLGVD